VHKGEGGMVQYISVRDKTNALAERKRKSMEEVRAMEAQICNRSAPVPNPHSGEGGYSQRGVRRTPSYIARTRPRTPRERRARDAYRYTVALGCRGRGGRGPHDDLGFIKKTLWTGI
jgi:hypothetical protein